MQFWDGIQKFSKLIFRPIAHYNYIFKLKMANSDAYGAGRKHEEQRVWCGLVG